MTLICCPVEKRTMTTSLLQPLKEKNHDMTFLEHEHEFLSGVNRQILHSRTTHGLGLRPITFISTHLSSSGILTSSHGFIQSRAELIFIVKNFNCRSSLFFPIKRELNFTKKCQHCLHYLGSTTHRLGNSKVCGLLFSLPCIEKGKI
jgi:hypothetical protein